MKHLKALHLPGTSILSTEHNWTPVQIWTNGMIDLQNQGLTAVADVAGMEHSVEDLYWYGYDPHAPRPGDDGLSSVVVDNVLLDVPDNVLLDVPDNVIQQLVHTINPMDPSDNFAI